MATLVCVQVCSLLEIYPSQSYPQVISLHTFMGLFWSIGVQGRAARLTALGIVSCIWLFVILFCGLGAGIHNTSGDLYAVSLPHPFWRLWTHGEPSDSDAILVLGIREVHEGTYRRRILLDLGCPVRVCEFRHLPDLPRSMLTTPYVCTILDHRLRSIILLEPRSAFGRPSTVV